MMTQRTFLARAAVGLLPLVAVACSALKSGSLSTGMTPAQEVQAMGQPDLKDNIADPNHSGASVLRYVWLEPGKAAIFGSDDRLASIQDVETNTKQHVEQQARLRRRGRRSSSIRSRRRSIICSFRSRLPRFISALASIASEAVAAGSRSFRRRVPPVSPEFLYLRPSGGRSSDRPPLLLAHRSFTLALRRLPRDRREPPIQLSLTLPDWNWMTGQRRFDREWIVKPNPPQRIAGREATREHIHTTSFASASPSITIGCTHIWPPSVVSQYGHTNGSPVRMLLRTYAPDWSHGLRVG